MLLPRLRANSFQVLRFWKFEIERGDRGRQRLENICFDFGDMKGVKQDGIRDDLLELSVGDFADLR